MQLVKLFDLCKAQVRILDRKKSSDKLSQLELQLTMDNYLLDILWFRVMEANGEWCIKRHMHSSFEFHLVAEGKCRVILDDGEFEAEEGKFYVTAPGVYHEQCGLGESGHYVEYSINYDFIKLRPGNTEAEVIFNILTSEPCKLVNDKYKIIKHFEEALKEAYFEEIGYLNNIKNSAQKILVLTARALRTSEHKAVYEVLRKFKSEDYRFNMMEKFIEDNIANDITTKELAKFMFLSDKQVYRIIKHRTGKSTIKYINCIRLKKAKELLKNSDRNIKSIAEILGFTSEYYFNQFFKREEGYPPGRFRQNIGSV
jgi:AraC-like DNA-binding protein